MIGVAGGTTIRCAKYATFGTQGLPDHAIEALEGRLACLLGQHGQMLLGKTLESALCWRSKWKPCRACICRR